MREKLIIIGQDIKSPDTKAHQLKHDYPNNNDENASSSNTLKIVMFDFLWFQAGNIQAVSAKNVPSLLDEEEVLLAKKHVPLFLTEFILEPSQIIFQPDLNAFQENINEVIRQFQDTVLGVENLIPGQLL